MVNIWRNDEADAVYGQRASREGNPLKRLCYAAFYRVFNAIVDTRIPPDTGDFALMDRSVYECLRSFPERVQFLRGLRSWVGFRQVALPYRRPERHAGRPKYTFRHLYALATDGIASFSVAPLKVAQVLAFLWFLGTIGTIVWLVATRPLSDVDPLFVIGILLGLSMAMLFLCIYILGAYISRMYLETKHRPVYIASAFSPGTPSPNVQRPE
jgi:dolichol-phosphate mannosyltransferase